MKSIALTGITLFVPILLTAADPPTLDVKLGLWESQSTSQMSGSMPLPPDMLSKLTPEQRAKIEAAAKAREAKGPQTQTTTTCVTKETLAKGLNIGQDAPGCKRTLVRGTSSVQEYRYDCDQAGMKSSGDLRIEAMNPENVKGSIKMTSAGGGQGMNVNVNFTAHWVSSDCSSKK
jgi:hypothetical protein